MFIRNWYNFCFRTKVATHVKHWAVPLTSKSITDKKYILKSLITFDIAPVGHVFKLVVKSWIVIPQQRDINDIKTYHNNFLRRWEMDEIVENEINKREYSVN